MNTNRREIRARQGVERRALSEAEKSAGYIGAIRSVIPYFSDSGEIRERATNNGKPFVEQIARGAFSDSLTAGGEIMAFVGHTDDPLSAFARAGANLTFTETPDGLQWEALAPDTAACRDLMKLTESGVIKGASFEFSVRSSGETWSKRDGRDIRTITAANLHAVNPVAWPAYDAGALTVAMRSARGMYAFADTYDPTISEDVCFAMEALTSELQEFSEAQEYLRTNPNGAHVAYAQACVSDCGEEIKAMLDWLAVNGSTATQEIMRSAKDALASSARSNSVNTKFPERAYWAARFGLL